MEEITPATIVKTLVSSGFELIRATRKPSFLAFQTRRIDEFGSEQRHLFAYSGEQKLSSADVSGLHHIANQDNAALIVIGAAESESKDICQISSQQFLARLGGAVYSFLPLEPEYPQQLSKLGQNELPDGLSGKADDLFEMYVHAGLEFLLQEKVVRYGQERRFESVADGLVSGRRSILALYDCKAAKDGYDINRDSIRQFADYINDFHRRYAEYIGRLHAFLVVSGSFQSPETLASRSDELYAECQVRLVFLYADEMGKIVELLADRPAFRRSLDWRKIFSSTLIQAVAVEKNLGARDRDKVIQP